MPFNHITEMEDLTPDALREIVDQSILISDGTHKPKAIERGRPREMTGVGIFEKQSLRTWTAFQAALGYMGFTPVIRDGSIFKKEKSGEVREPEGDVAGHFGAQARIIGARVYSNSTIRRLVDGVGESHIINLLCDKHHPMQTLADLAMTLKIFPKMDASKITVTYVGEWNNVSTSLAQGCAMLGIQFVHSGPLDGHLQSKEWNDAQRFAATSGSKVRYCKSLQDAVAGVQVVYGDTWVSMGDEDKKAEQIATYGGYQVTPAVMEKAAKDAVYLHCAPAYRGMEVHEDVLDGPQGKFVIPLGGMRLNAQVAALEYLIKTE